MKEISYVDAKYPVRADFAEGHNRFWKKLAAPGNWLTGAERIAVAQEVRQAWHCDFCARRKAALSPNHVEGAHESVSELPDAMVEIVHRVITDNGRLTKTWYRGVVRQGVTAEEYIEIIGVVVHALLIDEFCRAIGHPLHDLPQPLAGEPSRYRPAKTDDDTAWVPMLPASIESGPDMDLDGKISFNVVRALSLVPDSVRTVIDLLGIHYLELEDIDSLENPSPRAIDRSQMEAVAARVSAFNDCFY